MKKLAKSLVAAILGHQVRRLQKKNQIKVIGVVGSIGKTSTKLAIAQVLSQNFKVQYQSGNYNDLVSVPLIFFGEELPSLYNPFAWLAVFWRNRKQLKKPYAYDVVIVEFGSDGPGQITGFKSYLSLDIAVITAITPEHMQSFSSIDAVAEEETAVGSFSSLMIANSDLCGAKYLKEMPELLTYGIHKPADYKPEHIKLPAGRSEVEQYSMLAAAAVGQKLAMKLEDIQSGFRKISPVPGRMQLLKGVSGSTIVDDTYNSSPAAAKLALDYLYAQNSPQKIAVLGNMNELGGYSKKAHQEIGDYCDPKGLDLVITIGRDANRYLAPAADAKGCEVHQFDSPYAAGEYLKPILQKRAIILIKGSQNGVFAEETAKTLLANPSDAKKLVRQTAPWLKVKQKAFKT